MLRIEARAYRDAEQRYVRHCPKIAELHSWYTRQVHGGKNMPGLDAGRRQDRRRDLPPKEAA